MVSALHSMRSSDQSQAEANQLNGSRIRRTRPHRCNFLTCNGVPAATIAAECMLMAGAMDMRKNRRIGR